MQFKLNKKNSGFIFYNVGNKDVQFAVGNNITPYTKKIDQRLKMVSCMPFHSLLKATVEVPKTIDEFDLDSFIIDASYKQLSIDQDANYNASYLRVDNNFDADNWVYDVYLADVRYLDRSYGELIDKTKYIDVITSVCFLPLILYKTNKLDTVSNHIFVYIGDNSGVFAFYSKGVLIYSKSLSSNVHKLRIEFNQESSLELNIVEFENMISGKIGAVPTYRPYIESILHKINGDIEEILLYTRKVYQDIEPSCMYYGMTVEYSDDFLYFLKNALALDVKPFHKLSPAKNAKDSLAVASLAILYANYVADNIDCNFPNFSHAKRPKPLNKRNSWQTVMVAGNLLILSLVYPIYNFSMMGFFYARGSFMQNNYDNTILPKAEQYRKDEESMKIQIDALNKQKQSVEDDINSLRNNMGDIRAWQINYVQKSKILEDILQMASDSKVRVIRATTVSDDNKYLVVELNLYANNQKEISDFIKVLNEKKEYKSVITDRIERVIMASGDGEKLETAPLLRIDNADTKNDANDNENVVEEEQNTENVDENNGDNTDNPDSNNENNIENQNNQNVKKENKKPPKKIDSISAKVDLSGNKELIRSVDGHLNSIVRIVVR